MPAPRIHIVTRSQHWLLGTLVILLLALTFHQTLKQVTELNERDTLNMAARLRSQFQQMETVLEAMRGQAEERLRSNPQSALTRQLYQALRTDPELGFSLDKVPANLPAGLSGNLTGLGRLPAPGSEREARLHLALSLSPLLSTASKLLGDKVAWLYFTGVDDFIYLYPWIPSSEFRFHRAIYLKSYWQDALKQQNPSQRAIVSRPYEDFAGEGQMISLSQPIVKDQVLVGVISIDVLLERLDRLLHESTPAIGTLFLVNQHQQILASSAQGADFVPKFQTDRHGYQWRQGALQLVQAIPDTQLTLIHRIPLTELTQALFWHSLPSLITILFMVWAALSSLKARRLNRQLDYLSSHDALTGAYNRHYFDEFERLHLRAKARKVGVVMFDCDHFKQVNDRFGHEVGDQVLIRLVTLCQPLLRKEDALIRWGGEEFLLLARGSEPLEQLAERLRLQIAEHPWEEIAPGLAVTISLGYHHCPAGTPLQEAIHRADLALYQAKANGRNRSEGWQDDGAKNTG
ncbi:diguanylate cyclase [Aeromonas salmonicida]|uniref:sensor domain-containing diguanylate cyclase n=1 Tax=Aeromonas salmonicida TaxID=645 RepID=UPI00259D3858|nr:sensor domain-containing diguanylate cyclase [Aeromonas salmonicida]MDM5067197.1 diguanylate cyclase [Aeromonas salmonicida]